MRSGPSVLTFIEGRLAARCSILATVGKVRTLTTLSGRCIGLIIDSMVVPRVSNFRLYGAVGSSLDCDRVPIMLLATGAGVRSGVRKLRLKTSTCVRGPFSIRCLLTGVSDLVRGHRGLHRAFTGSPFITTGAVTLAGTSRRFV